MSDKSLKVVSDVCVKMLNMIGYKRLKKCFLKADYTEE